MKSKDLNKKSNIYNGTYKKRCEKVTLQLKFSINKSKFEPLLEYLNQIFLKQSVNSTEQVERCIFFTYIYAKCLEKKGWITDGNKHDFCMGEVNFKEAVLEFNSKFNEFKNNSNNNI